MRTEVEVRHPHMRLCGEADRVPPLWDDISQKR